MNEEYRNNGMERTDVIRRCIKFVDLDQINMYNPNLY